MCLRLLLKESLHWRWLSWDNEVVYICHDNEVDVTWRIEFCESTWIWFHLWKIHPFENLSPLNLPWSRWISETIQLTLEMPNLHKWSLAVSDVASAFVNTAVDDSKGFIFSGTSRDSVSWADWLIIKMILRVVAWRVWAYFASLTMTWVNPLPTKRALRTPERGPMTQRDSITLLDLLLIVDWEVLDHMLRGLNCWVTQALAWWLSWLPSLNILEDRLDTTLEAWGLVAIEVLLIYFILIAIDWLLFDLKDALLEWVDHVDLELWRALLSCDSPADFAQPEVVQEQVESELMKTLKVLLMLMLMLMSLPRLMKPLTREEDLKNELLESLILLTPTWYCSSVEARMFERDLWTTSDHRSGTMIAPDIEVTVSTNVNTLRFSTSPWTL